MREQGERKSRQQVSKEIDSSRSRSTFSHAVPDVDMRIMCPASRTKLHVRLRLSYVLTRRSAAVAAAWKRKAKQSSATSESLSFQFRRGYRDDESGFRVISRSNTKKSSEK